MEKILNITSPLSMINLGTFLLLNFNQIVHSFRKFRNMVKKFSLVQIFHKIKKLIAAKLKRKSRKTLK